jgi:ParB family transcriptional regulator, chromosome partitioning protein
LKKKDLSASIKLSKSNFLNAAKGAALTQDLGDLLSTEESKFEKVFINVDLIEDNPFQPRIYISEDSLLELASSIEADGLLQPIIVQKKENAYIVIAGHRRLYATRLINQKNIWVNIIEEEFSDTTINDKLLFKKAAIENLQREQLDPLELAISCTNAMTKELYLTKEELSQALNKSRTFIVKVMSIVKLSKSILTDLNVNKSIKDVESLYELQKIKDIKIQEELYFKLVSQEITRDYIREHNKKKKDTSNEVFSMKKTKNNISLSIDLKQVPKDKITQLEESIKLLIEEYKR